MFVGIAIVCVFVGLVVRPAEEQRRAVEVLREVDGVTTIASPAVRKALDRLP